VEHPLGGDLEAGGLERLPVDVLVQVECAREQSGNRGARQSLEHFGAAGRNPELRFLRVLAGAEHASPDPGNEVAPVVEVPVRDRDRVELGPGLPLAQTSEHARSAVQQDAPPGALQEIPGLGSARVRPGRGTPSYDEFHACIIAIYLPPVARKIRVVIAKPGLDGHDRGAKIIARALRDAGMEVIYTGLHQTPEQIVETAIQEDADAVGISILSGAHMTLVPRILDGLKENGAEDVLVVLGGTIPTADADELKGQGVAAVFTPGAPTSEIVDFLRETGGRP
jgi:methylmalonyl-CoA mutase C-terminal domain/subunit